MAKQVSEPIQTFSVGYPSLYYNEFSYARDVALSIGAHHHEVIMQAEDLFGQLPRLIWHEDAPIRTSSSVALYHVAQLAAEHVKVVLTGEGSDELFAGYSRYWASLINQKWGRVYERVVPKTIRDHWIRKSLWCWPLPSAAKQKLSHTFLNHDLAPHELIFDNFIAIFPQRVHRQLFTDDMLAAVGDIDPYNDLMAIYHGRGGSNRLDQLLYTDQKSYLVELLKKQDKMSMAASIESRVPFLDHKLVEFAARVPQRLKLNGRTEKYLVKRAFHDRLPTSVQTREKMGFPVPTREWLREGCDRVVKQILLHERTAQRGIFRPEFLAELLEQHRSRRRDRTDALWMALNFELWSRIFIDGEDSDSIAAEISSNFRPAAATPSLAAT
jgi:asparagine synthase (glutamine-hydrolysing)